MVFASPRVQRYIQFRALADSLKAMALGPVYFLWVGFIEAVLVYVFFGLLWELEGVILAHLLVAFPFPVWAPWLLHLRGYERSTQSDVAGRYRLGRTLWSN